MSDIPEDQLVAVRRFVAAGFAIVDAALRRPDPARLDELDTFIRQVTNGLYRLPAFEGVVYRGTALSEDAARNYVPGQIVRERAFVCATADPSRRFPGNTTYVIASINGRDVSMLAEDPGERQVVFFTNTRFKVLAVEVDARADDRFIYLAEIPDPRLMQPEAES